MMKIISVQDGAVYKVETADEIVNVPKHEGNSQYKLVQEWLAIPGNDLLPEPPPPEPPTLDEVYDQAMQNNQLIKALVLSLNDGTFVPGSGYTNAEMKTIIKANM